MIMTALLEKVYQNFVFLDAVDSYINGVFDGEEIITVENMSERNDIVFILTHSAAKEIIKILNEKYENKIKYVIVNYPLDEWKNNI